MTVFSKRISLGIAVKTVSVIGIVALAVWYRARRSRKAPQVVVCSTKSHWEEVAADFRKSLSDGLLGLDCEWVTVGSKVHRVALIQMAANPELCVMIRLSQMALPDEVREILEDSNIIKFGVAIMDDAKKLEYDYGIKVNGCLDLRYMALASGYEHKDTKGLSLAALSSHYANYELDKTSSTRYSNWESPRLSERQRTYAARDAFAGVLIARSLLRSSLISSLAEKCSSSFGLYIDKPFRLKPEKKTQSKKKPSAPVLPPKRMPVTMKDQQLYKNAVMKAPDGEILCNTDVAKIHWYLEMNLATLESENPLTVRLNFDPRGRAVLGGEFYIDEKLNICVVCGKDKLLLKKNVVPLEYRKQFPELMKSHTSHDIVLICINCQHESTRHDASLRAVLDAECPAEVSPSIIPALKRAARALKTARDKLPESRRIEFIKLLEEHFKTPVTDETIDEASQLDEQQWMRDRGLTHAQRVVAKYSAGEGLFALESRLRQHFLDTMQPQYLSPKWCITHNHDAVLVKLAVGRYLGPHTYDEFLKIVGASWRRVGELVIATMEAGIVNDSQIVIWNELREAGVEIPNNNAPIQK